MMDHLEAIVGLVLGGIGFITSVGGGLAWYKSRVAEDVARKRDFVHLKNNYSQMTENLTSLVKEMDERFDHVDHQLNRIELRTDRDRTNPL